MTALRNALIPYGSLFPIMSPDRNNAMGKIRRVLYWRTDFDNSRGADVICLRVEVEIDRTGKKTHYKEGDVVIWSIPYSDIIAGKYPNLKANMDQEGIPCTPPPELLANANDTINLQPKPPKSINFNMVGAISKKKSKPADLETINFGY